MNDAWVPVTVDRNGKYVGKLNFANALNLGLVSQNELWRKELQPLTGFPSVNLEPHFAAPDRLTTPSHSTSPAWIWDHRMVAVGGPSSTLKTLKLSSFEVDSHLAMPLRKELDFLIVEHEEQGIIHATWKFTKMQLEMKLKELYEHVEKNQLKVKDPFNIQTFIISSAEENEDSPDNDETDSDERRPQKPPFGHCNTYPASLSDPSLPPPRKRPRRRYEQSQAFERHHAQLGRYATGVEMVERFLKKQKFETELQARQVRALECFFNLMKTGRYTHLKASQTAAAAHRFGMSYGAKNIHSWADRFETEQGALPMSNHGRHAKIFSLLNDPEHCEMLRAWVQQEKKNMDPAKLAAYSQNVLIPSQLEKSMKEKLRNEMPMRLKGYLEETFFPNAGWKPKRGISLRTARKWLPREGFR
ncbi:hypothetical protein BT69DRAFT_1335511 [Atractiella rhizophila]|nr:hypothetical protein BT69DRAFT_1335511 [Atractiella rhizophila]